MVVDGDGDVNLVVNEQPESVLAEVGPMLSFQRLDVYQRAIEFLALAYEVVDSLPRGHADRADEAVVLMLMKMV